jgi:hypothetical protein
MSSSTTKEVWSTKNYTYTKSSYRGRITYKTVSTWSIQAINAITTRHSVAVVIVIIKIIIIIQLINHLLHVFTTKRLTCTAEAAVVNLSKHHMSSFVQLQQTANTSTDWKQMLLRCLIKLSTRGPPKSHHHMSWLLSDAWDWLSWSIERDE